MEENEMDVVCLFYCEKWPYLLENPINLNHKMRENEQASCYASSTDRGIHHGLTVVPSGHFALLILINPG